MTGDAKYGIPGESGTELPKVRDERRYALGDLVREEQAHFTYVYDFGDNWKHDLVVEKILSPEEDVQYPVCLARARAPKPK